MQRIEARGDVEVGKHAEDGANGAAALARDSPTRFFVNEQKQEHVVL